MEAEVAGREVAVSGNNCKRGEDYVRKEILAPERGLTATVLVRNGSLPLASVKLSKAIPKRLIAKAMQEIATITADAPIRIGDVLARRVAGTDADLVATKNIGKKR